MWRTNWNDSPELRNLGIQHHSRSLLIRLRRKSQKIRPIWLYATSSGGILRQRRENHWSNSSSKKRIINIDECNNSGLTALHIAAIASNVTTARHLLAKGADINRRDKEGITPLLLAAKFAKDMELIDLFLNDKKVNLRDRDEFGQNVIAYAEKNTYGLGQEIIDRVKEIDYEILEQ